MKHVLIGMLAAQGVEIAEERAESVARTIAAQLESERAATLSLAFEQEPAVFLRRLEEGSR